MQGEESTRLVGASAAVCAPSGAGEGVRWAFHGAHTAALAPTSHVLSSPRMLFFFFLCSPFKHHGRIQA